MKKFLLFFLLALTTITSFGAITITPSTAPNSYLNHEYAMNMTATGGKAPYQWAITAGALPTGINMTTAGLQRGLTTAVGTFTYTVRATDALNITATKSYTMTVTRKSINQDEILVMLKSTNRLLPDYGGLTDWTNSTVIPTGAFTSTVSPTDTVLVLRPGSVWFKTTAGALSSGGGFLTQSANTYTANTSINNTGTLFLNPSGNYSLTVGGTRTERSTGNYDYRVNTNKYIKTITASNGNTAETIAGTHTKAVTGLSTETYSAGLTQNITGNYVPTITGIYGVTVSGSNACTFTLGGNYIVNGAGNETHTLSGTLGLTSTGLTTIGSNSLAITGSSLQIPSGAGANKVLTSDGSGFATWQTPASPSGFLTQGSNTYTDNTILNPTGYIRMTPSSTYSVGAGGAINMTAYGGGNYIQLQAGAGDFTKSFIAQSAGGTDIGFNYGVGGDINIDNLSKITLSAPNTFSCNVGYNYLTSGENHSTTTLDDHVTSGSYAITANSSITGTSTDGDIAFVNSDPTNFFRVSSNQTAITGSVTVGGSSQPAATLDVIGNTKTSGTLNVGNTGTFTTNVPLQVNGTFAFPATSGTTSTALFRLDPAKGAFDFGFSGIGGWMQCYNAANMASTIAMCIQPNGGKLGIGTGTVTPNAQLCVRGEGTGSGTITANFRNLSDAGIFSIRDDRRIIYTDGNEGVGKVLTSDVNGVATWQSPLPITLYSVNTHSYTVSSGVSTVTLPVMQCRVESMRGLQVSGDTVVMTMNGQFTLNTSSGSPVLILTISDFLSSLASYSVAYNGGSAEVGIGNCSNSTDNIRATVDGGTIKIYGNASPSDGVYNFSFHVMLFYNPA